MKTFYEIMEEKDLNNLTPLEYAIWFLESATGASGAQQAASELAALISESQSRQRALFEKSDELTAEWKRAEKAEAQLAALRERVEAVEADNKRMRDKLIMVSKWFERQAGIFSEQAQQSRFITISKAAKFDAENYQAMANDTLKAALKGEPK